MRVRDQHGSKGADAGAAVSVRGEDGVFRVDIFEEFQDGE